MKQATNSSRLFRGLVAAGLLAAPLLAFNAKATDITWTGINHVYDADYNDLGYALWNDPGNWSTGATPTDADKLHFNQQPGTYIPCVIDNFAATVDGIALGDWGGSHGSGAIILTNGATLTAGVANGTWCGVGFPEGECKLTITTNCTVTFGSHLWVGNGTNSDGTTNWGIVTVDGGTLNILNGQLGLGWNGKGATNYMFITNNGTVNLGQWNRNQTLGGSAYSWGILDISAGGKFVVNGNITADLAPLKASGQITGWGGAGDVSWSYDSTANKTTVIGVAPVTASTPVISAQPTNVVLSVGGTASFSVTVANVTCTYQWYLNSTPVTDGNGITGSTTATLTIANAAAANAGVYSVYVTNKNDASFWVHSSGASLTTDTINMYPVITVTGVAGNTYEVDYTTSLTPPVTWTPLTTVTLGGATQLVVDTASPMSSARFYKVVQQ